MNESNKIRTQFNVYLGNDPEATELLNQINTFRKLAGMNWKNFIFFSMAGAIAKENAGLARAIIDYITRAK